MSCIIKKKNKAIEYKYEVRTFTVNFLVQQRILHFKLKKKQKFYYNSFHYVFCFFLQNKIGIIIKFWAL